MRDCFSSGESYEKSSRLIERGEFLADLTAGPRDEPDYFDHLPALLVRSSLCVDDYGTGGVRFFFELGFD
jgi:hypothetical protein